MAQRKSNPGRKGSHWRTLAASVPGDRCYFCGYRIPTEAECRAGRYLYQPWNHPLARTVHHIIELDSARSPEELERIATDPANLAPAHRCCNSAGRAALPLRAGNLLGRGTPSENWG